MKSASPYFVQNEFSKLAKTYARRRSPRALREGREFVSWLGLSPGESALDAASGPGLLAKLMASIVRRPVFAVDISLPMLEHARRRPQHTPCLVPSLADVQRLPFRSECFDAVTCTYSFANFPNPLAVLREFARVTRPGGRIGIIDVIAPSDPEENRRLNHLEASRSRIYTRLMMREEFDELFQAANLRLTQCRACPRRQSVDEWLRLSPAIDRRSSRLVTGLGKASGAAMAGRQLPAPGFMSYITSWFLLHNGPPPRRPQPQFGAAVSVR